MLHHALLDWQVRLYLLELQPPSPVYSGSSIWTQILSVLLVGLLTAFAFQLLLTNLGLAIAISLFRGQSTEQQDFSDESINKVLKEAEPENFVSGVGVMAGFGILLTVNTVLFSACFLAVKFAQLSNPTSGAIAGIVIWSAYFLLLIWISSVAVNSLIGSALETTIGGFRRLVSTIAAALRVHHDQPINEEQAKAIVRQEIESVLDPIKLQQTLFPSALALSATNGYLSTTQELWQKVESYLDTTSAKKLTPKRIERQLQKMLRDEKTLPQCDRLVLIEWLNQRQDLTDKQKQRIVNQIAETWEDYGQEIAQSESDSIEENSTLSPIQSSLLKAALSTTIEQVLANLPQILNGSDLASFALPGTGDRDNLNGSPLLENSVSSLKRDRTDEDTPSGALATYSDRFRDALGQPLESVQQAVKERINALKRQAQQQVEATRQAAATACWWLLAIALTGAISSALAGVLATR